jgi:hypothetical protein
LCASSARPSDFGNSARSFENPPALRSVSQVSGERSFGFANQQLRVCIEQGKVFVLTGHIREVAWPSNKECQTLRRFCAADVLAKLVTLSAAFVQIDEHKIVQVSFPPAARFYDVGGAIDIHPEFAHHFRAQIPHMRGGVDQKHSLFPRERGKVHRKWHPGKRSVHDGTAFGFAGTGASIDFTFLLAAANNSRVRFLRAIFCLRSR